MKRSLTAGLSVLAIFAGSALAQQPYERSDTRTAYPESRTDGYWQQDRRAAQRAPRTYDSHDPNENSAVWGVGG
jgi:hypothetical protein